MNGRNVSVGVLTKLRTGQLMNRIPLPGTNRIFYGKQSKSVPLQAWTGPEGSRKLRFPEFVTTAQVVRLTHRPPLPPGNTPGTHFCQRLSRLQGHGAIGRITSMKNSNDIIGNRTSDHPICSTAP